MSDDEFIDTRPAPGIDDADPEDTIKILLATDNHIGYLERDPIRGQDSITTFKEILQLAVKHQVDFILLAGDLFHENKPSRDSLYQTLALLREYTLGDRPIPVELLSDPDEGHAPGFSFPAVNYEDPNLNVSIPVFSIHGNHDDPQGPGVNGALCALDVLSVSGLLNYMGKFDLPVSDADAATTGIAVRPVLLRKGNTHLGMYGIGNVKDQRMHFELRSNRVRMYMPRDKEKWFNILLVHQNRVKHGPQEYVPEGMFDDSVDLVVWGHEHDCRIVPEPVAGKNYYITQPGSSVATSLADGEALEKHVALLEIKGKDFQLTPIPLRTVRPFVIDQVVLEDVAEEEGLDINDQMEITKYLKAKVNALINQAHELHLERTRSSSSPNEPNEPPTPEMLPLIRLKVDTTNVTQTSNPIRFGQEFQGRVANPRDMLVFHRAKKSAARRGANNSTSTGNNGVNGEALNLGIDGDADEDADMSVSEKLARVRMGSLVKEYLKAQELQLLGESGMSDAIAMFVEKDDTHAIQSHVQKSLQQLMKNVTTNEQVEEDDLEDLLAKAKRDQDDAYNQKKEARRAAKANQPNPQTAPDSDDSMLADDMAHTGHNANLDSDYSMDDDAPPPPPKRRGAASKTSAPAKKAPAKRAPAAKKTAAAAPKKAPARGKGKKKAVSSDDEDEVEVIELEDDDDDDDEYGEEEEEVVVKPVKRTNRAAVLSQPPPKKAPAKRKAPAASTQSQLNFAPAGRAGGSSRAAAGRGRKRVVVDDDDEDD